MSEMKKDKKWLLHEVRKLPCELQNGHGKIKVVDIFPLLDQLDEPKKVVIPQFVADEFDYNKKPYWEVDESKDVSHILKCAFGNEGKQSELVDWVRENPEDYVMAVRNGYEVEKEKLYYVIDKSKRPILTIHEGKVVASVSVSKVERAEKLSTSDFKYRLTEKQIKDYDGRYWSFAVEVAE